MTVKIVTDSLCDLTNDMAEKLGITIVPLSVLFGHEAFLDRVTITPEQFYDRLIHGEVWPTTTQPSPADFTKVYEKLAEETNEILVITLSSKLSGTYQSATAAINMIKKKCRIEVIDSLTVAMGLGLVVISAAQKAGQGTGLDEMTAYVRRALERSHFVAYFDTLKYLARGGRIGKAQRLLGSVLSVKPILTVKEGEMAPLTRVRSQAGGIEYLYNFVTGFHNIDSIAVEHTTQQENADQLAERFSKIVPKDHIYRSTVSPVLGVHGGPNALAVTVLEAESKG